MTPFGTTAEGRAVHRIVLSAGELTVALLTRGAVIQSVRLAGVAHDLTHGSDSLADYEGPMRYHGALIGPVVNRISGGEAVIAGQRHEFEKNQGGRHTLHCGAAGTMGKVWDVAETGPAHAVLALDLPDGEGGFPGNRRVTARFAVAPPATLTLRVTCTTDAPTILNFANHSYWNLDGADRWDGHWLRVAADRYLPTTGAFIPTGEIRDVTGTDMDLRQGKAVSAHHPDFDTNYCLSDTRQPLRDVMWLRGQSGVQLTMATTSPGLQIYDGRNAIRPGKAPFEGLAFEAQYWPDATNNPTFPSIELPAGGVYDETTQWRFSR